MKRNVQIAGLPEAFFGATDTAMAKIFDEFLSAIEELVGGKFDRLEFDSAKEGDEVIGEMTEREKATLVYLQDMHKYINEEMCPACKDQDHALMARCKDYQSVAGAIYGHLTEEAAKRFGVDREQYKITYLEGYRVVQRPREQRKGFDFGDMSGIKVVGPEDIEELLGGLA